MASRSVNRALVLSLAVITGILLVITASWRLTSSSSEPPHSAGGEPAAAEPSQPNPTTAAASHSARAQRSGSGSTSGSPLGAAVHGNVRPATPMRVIIDSPQGQPVLSAPVDPLAATHNSDGSWAPIDPPSVSRAVWMSQSAAPAAPSTGTTAIYGHACIGFTCAFNNAINARLGSTVIVETNRTVLRYRVSAITQYPKTGAGSLASRPNTANELALITCAYRADQTSINNLVITANLISARNK